ncbi:uncharacterized protein LY89DRAFT_325736 [Mollisia scopiformis]|uniref:Uncharacterized protein n=1 Tax=Mollisia scopiformis TaxID=149040 RepID=A0A132BAQ7_MOLSC|nr:uncharacterized protein LY89DRAFT_325736 [Mollisia scopiformis]KUJ08747.1 hypothetical protein LY89DRAFT_325736 [Mollisia scopiformis]
MQQALGSKGSKVLSSLDITCHHMILGNPESSHSVNEDQCSLTLLFGSEGISSLFRTPEKPERSEHVPISARQLDVDFEKCAAQRLYFEPFIHAAQHLVIARCQISIGYLRYAYRPLFEACRSQHPHVVKYTQPDFLVMRVEYCAGLRSFSQEESDDHFTVGRWS